MLNLFRAQWYRLVRNRAFWGLLIVFGSLVFLFVIQVDEQSVREGVYRNFPALGGAPEGVRMTVDVEAVLGQFWVPQLLMAFVGMLSAAFFGDDFRYAGTRSLDGMPGFRWRYVGSAALIIVVIAAIFLAVASLVAWLALLPNPVMGVWLSGGRFLRWGLLLVAISLVYAMAALAVVAASNRAGLGIIAFFLLVGVLPDALLQMAAGWLSAFQGPIVAMISTLPSTQLRQLSVEGFTPAATDMLMLLPWLVAAMVGCGLVMRYKRL